ncbi:glycoside hydrolase superfamily [Pseudomassariella vexata]|uniref:Glycoside hydrolase superfamily n=1 Tax=Pseudomassariella vexata TaxID=1141098 RepID=A0A1Y2DY57_9PEZI|nr:glycoside hydrolase superfamily [Pseudomassariella vexata]ORY64183.1 glycoside hydrolase superfamily [Pseudomassariella vexata]
MKTLAIYSSVALLATSVCSSWVPTPPALPHYYASRGLNSALPRAENSTGSWPYGPLKTQGRHIVNARGDVISWAGVNWPMSGESMIPEGLEWASVDDILDMIQSVGFNFIRMGYAIQMVDEIYDRNGEDVPLDVAMIMAVGYENGTKITNEIISKNPGWTAQTTRFEIWSDIADAALKKGIFIHPDVHVGKAMWCCSHVDGNSWFDDLNFNASEWRRGLAYIATWAKDHPNVASMSLRNELRESWNVTDLYYNWQTLIGNMSAGADAIYEANPDLLISWSGMQYDQDLSALISGKNILTAPCYKCTAIRDAYRSEPEYFDLDSYPWADKIVWELHLYGSSEDVDTGTCEIIEAGLYRNGFNALGIDAPSGCNITSDCPPATRLTPVILSEFGHAQASTLYNDTLQNCLQEYTKKHGISWAMWSLAGSYRIRSGVQGLQDIWGLTNFEWSGWLDPDTIEGYWKPWVEAMNVTTL